MSPENDTIKFTYNDLPFILKDGAISHQLSVKLKPLYIEAAEVVAEALSVEYTRHRHSHHSARWNLEKVAELLDVNFDNIEVIPDKE